MDVRQIAQLQLAAQSTSGTDDTGADERPRKAPYVPPAVIRHGTVQRVTLGGGSFIP